ncbi:23820_t:CDS:1, partial [Racocetra persica]
NNQCGILGGSAQNIHLPPDLPSTSEPVSDIKKYISKCPSDASSNFYLYSNQDWQVTSIWYHKKHCGINKVQNFMKDIGNKVKVKLLDRILTNYSGRKTTAQILQDADIPEDAIMKITGYKSSQGVRAYKNINEQQHINIMRTLINIIELLTDSKNIINQDPSVIFAESTSSYINVNSFSAQGTIPIGQGQIA